MASREDVTVALPTLGQAEAMNAIFIDRYRDTTPGSMPWIPDRIELYRTEGVEMFRRRIVDTTQNPQRHFIRAAMIDQKVVGFACGGIDFEGNDGYSYEKCAAMEGLIIDRQYEGWGAATMLEQARQAWAKDIGCTAIEGEIIVDNKRSWQFFERMGYKDIGQEPGPFPAMVFKRIRLTL